MKISIAIATYNGEKYIKKELQSMLKQTLPVDEIIISDDGSNDSTIKEIESLHESRITIVTDNQRHGFCGNFENAVRHCTGDYIFIADQDDLWTEDKVEKVVGFFQMNPTATCVFHDAFFIGKNDEVLDNVKEQFNIAQGVKQGILLDKEYLEPAVSAPLARGMCMCITRSLLDIALPFPKCNTMHDQWLLFCSLCSNSCFYLDQKLTMYRLHGDNTAGVNEYKGTLKQRVLRIYKRAMSSKHYSFDLYYLGNSMKLILEKYHLEDTHAYMTALRVCEIGEKEKEAFESGRIKGAAKLIQLYCTDMRYRRSGRKAIFYKLYGVLFGDKMYVKTD